MILSYPFLRTTEHLNLYSKEYCSFELNSPASKLEVGRFSS